MKEMPSATTSADMQAVHRTVFQVILRWEIIVGAFGSVVWCCFAFLGYHACCRMLIVSQIFIFLCDIEQSRLLIVAGMRTC